MKTKRIILAVTAVLMLLSLCGCKGTIEYEDIYKIPEKTSNEPSGEEEIQDETGESTIGYFTDDVDWYDRDPYKLVYICSEFDSYWTKSIRDGLNSLEFTMNFSLASAAIKGDPEKYIEQIDKYAGLGYDGFILAPDEDMAERAYEVCRELGVAFVGEGIEFKDSAGKYYWPSVIVEGEKNGEKCMEWLDKNYEQYWGKLNKSTLGLVVVGDSARENLKERENGTKKKFEELYPEAKENYYFVDMKDTDMTPEAASSGTAVKLTGNAEIEKWYIVTLTDDWAKGAEKAVQALAIEGKALVTCIQGDAFVSEVGTESEEDIWVSCNYISTMYIAKTLAAHVVAVLDGRATPEDIWPEWKSGGSGYACIKVEGEMFTKESYQEYIDSQQA